MTASAAGIRKRPARLWNKLPVIARGVEREFQHPKCIGVPYFAVGPGSRETPVGVVAAGAGHERANTTCRVSVSIRILRCKSLVIVIVSDHTTAF